jgi:hypothetical protein
MRSVAIGEGPHEQGQSAAEGGRKNRLGGTRGRGAAEWPHAASGPSAARLAAGAHDRPGRGGCRCGRTQPAALDAGSRVPYRAAWRPSRGVRTRHRPDAEVRPCGGGHTREGDAGRDCRACRKGHSCRGAVEVRAGRASSWKTWPSASTRWSAGCRRCSRHRPHLHRRTTNEPRQTGANVRAANGRDADGARDADSTRLPRRRARAAAEQVNQVRADPTTDPTERARTLGMLSGLALRAMDSRDLDARLEAVERVLKLRKDAEKDKANWSKRR